MSREDPQLRIRLPIELKEKIEASSKENNRSMNAEIVHRLEASLSKEDLNLDGLESDDLKEVVKVQAGLLEKYQEAFKRSTDVLSEVHKVLTKDEKPT